MASPTGKVKLIHITTVPVSLWAFFRGQIGYMRIQGIEVHGLSSPGEFLDKFAAREHVPVHAVEMPRQITPLGDVVALVRIYRHLHRIRPHIVHSHTPKGGLLGMLSAWFARVPARIYQIHGLPLMTATGLTRVLLWWSEKIACLLAHQVLCVSHSIRTVVLAEGLCPPSKIKVLAGGSINGVDATGEFNPERFDQRTRGELRTRYGIPGDNPVLGFVGRIARDKGIVELAAAWRVLSAEFPALHLLMIGPFESQDRLPGDVQALLHVDPRIHLIGSTDNIPPLYALMDIVVLPTYREGLPMVALEAAAMNLPVVATRIPGCVDAVQDGVTGTLIPCHNAPALATAVRQYLLAPDLRRRHGQAGRARVLRDFAQEPIWEAVYREYANLLRERGLTL